MRHFKQFSFIHGFFLSSVFLFTPFSAWSADKLNPEEKSDSQVFSEMRTLSKLPVPPAHKDFSIFRFRPAGDKAVEQSDRNRLMFWTKDGRPDGYAQRRGGAIIYYNAQGNATKVQKLTQEEMIHQ